MKQHLRIFTLLTTFTITITTAQAMESYSKLWSVAVIIGSFSDNSNLKYYLEPQLRLINDTYKFNQLLTLGGLGYQLTSRVSLFAGPGWVLTKNPQGIVSHEYRLWEQLNYQILNLNRTTIDSRTRLEERKNTNFNQIAIRLRERLWARTPIRNGSRFSLSCFDEVFFNLNHPKWVSSSFLEQNRAFVGIAVNLGKSAIFDVGYMNQYLISSQNELNNVLLFTFTVNA